MTAVYSLCACRVPAAHHVPLHRHRGPASAYARLPCCSPQLPFAVRSIASPVSPRLANLTVCARTGDAAAEPHPAQESAFRLRSTGFSEVCVATGCLRLVRCMHCAGSWAPVQLSRVKLFSGDEEVRPASVRAVHSSPVRSSARFACPLLAAFLTLFLPHVLSSTGRFLCTTLAH